MTVRIQTKLHSLNQYCYSCKFFWFKQYFEGMVIVKNLNMTIILR